MAESPNLRELYPGIKLPGDPEQNRPSPVTPSASAASAPVRPVDDMAGLYPGITLPPTTADVVKEVGTGVAQGTAQFSPVTAGMVQGARTGSSLLPFTPVTRLVGGIAGGAAGAVGGYLFGQELGDLFPAPSREDLVPYREGGITAGSIMTTAPAAFFMRADQATRVGRLIDSIGTAARARPKTYLGIESFTAGTAGIAGGTSEAYFPGQALPRFGSELAASVFTPGRFLVNTTTAAYDALANFIRSARDPATAQFKQATTLYNALDRVLQEVPAIKQLEELGTPQALAQAAQMRDKYYKDLIRQLERPSPSAPGVDPARPTAAQKTGDIGLSILELSLAKGDKAFGSVVQQQGVDALRANQLLIDALNKVDDQRILAMAASMQADLYDNMIAGRLSLAERLAAERAAKINANNPQSRRAIGLTVKQEVDTALDEARKFEKQLWDTAMQSVALRKVTSGARRGQVVERELVPRQLLIKYLDEISGMTPERATMGMPQEVRSIMSRLGITDESIAAYRKGKLTQQYLDTGAVPDEYLIGGVEVLKNGKTRVIPLGKNTTVQDLVNIRSDLLKYARDSAAGTSNRSPSDARFFGTLAEGALDDLQTLSSAAYDKARNFSRTLNDVFRRTYANQITAVERTGAAKIPAELLVSRAFGRDSDVTALRMDQITDAVGFFKRQYDDAVANFGPNSKLARELKPNADIAAGRISSVTDAMERALRLAASNPSIVNPQTGRVNPQALANWMARNQEALKPFGSLTNDLKNALDAENAFRSLADPSSAVSRQVRDQQAFAALLPGGERPTYAVTDILNSSNPVAGMRKLAAVVKDTRNGGGQGALNGLKSSLLEYAYTKAGGTTGGKFSIQSFDDALFRPLAPGQPSIVSIMRNEGLMTLTEIKNLRRLMDPMKRVETAMQNRVFLDQVVGEMGPVGDLAVRFLALHSASGAIPQGPGSLAAASAVSKAAKDIFAQMPRLNALATLKEAMQDPMLTASLLRVGRTESEKMAVLQAVRDRMSSAGLLMMLGQRGIVPAANVAPPAAEAQQERREAARALRMLPPAPSTRGVPSPKPPAGQQPPGPQSQAPAGGAPQTQSRAMLQSLFPFDTISAMAANQQPETPPAA